MDISKFLSKVMGIYLIIVSSMMLANMPTFNLHINNLINDAPLMFVTGFFTLIIGILAVVSHNIWEWSWRVIITLIAWLSVFKGVSLILNPEFIDKITLFYLQNIKIAYTAAGIDFVLGCVLCYFGFKR